MTTTPRTASTSAARKRKAEKDGASEREPLGEFYLDELPDKDLPPVLPDTSGWVKREPGDVIEAGTPYMGADSKALDGPLVQWKPNGRDYDWTVGSHHMTIWTPPPAPREPWRVISTDRDKPTLAKVTFGSDYATTAEVFVEGGYVWRVMDATAPQGVGSSKIGTIAMLTDVELLHTHDPETHVPVERALIDEAARAKHVAEPWGPLYDVVSRLAALLDGEGE